MPKSASRNGEPWSAQDVRQLKQLARENTPTRVIGLKLGRSEASVRGKAGSEGISLKPTNQSPYDRQSTDRKRSRVAGRSAGRSRR
jgi:hypothetical protein